MGLIRNYSHPTGPNHLTKVELKTNNQQMLSNGFEAKFWNNEKLAVLFFLILFENQVLTDIMTCVVKQSKLTKSSDAWQLPSKAFFLNFQDFHDLHCFIRYRNNSTNGQFSNFFDQSGIKLICVFFRNEYNFSVFCQFDFFLKSQTYKIKYLIG